MTTKTVRGDIKDAGLSGKGVLRVEWAGREMPVLRQIRERFADAKPLEGVRIAACLHVTSETANLALALRDGGAEVVLCASNPLSTQDEVAAALATEYGIETYAINGEDTKTYYEHINAALDAMPHLTLDDGMDLVKTLHSIRQDAITEVIGGCEGDDYRGEPPQEPGRGGPPQVPSRGRERRRHEASLRQTDTAPDRARSTGSPAPPTYCGPESASSSAATDGAGAASRSGPAGWARRPSSQRWTPSAPLEAAMDGHDVMTIEEAAAIGDIFITLTGGLKAVGGDHLEAMKDGALIANSGHFNDEIDIEALEEMAEAKRRVRPFVDEYTLEDGRRLSLLGEGRAHQPRRGGGAPARRHGHELRQPGARRSSTWPRGRIPFRPPSTPYRARSTKRSES